MPNAQPTLLERAIHYAEKLGIGTPLLVRSPGRVNLIGEHTDYNGGFALPGAIDKSVLLAFAPRADGMACLHSMDFDATYKAPLAELEPSEMEWPNLALGVAARLQRIKPLGGFDAIYGADLPRGAGLSSSAALACGMAFGLNHLFDIGLTFDEMLTSAVGAEHEFMGVMCGEMDQIVSLRAKEHCLMMLDCRNREFQYVPFVDDGLCLVLCDSQIRRKLFHSEYNKRRAQCESGVAMLAQVLPGIKSLRDVTMEFLHHYRGALNPTVFNRCLFVLQENDRAVMMVEALALKDFATAGRLLYASHDGLRDLYGVSCAELNKLVEGAARISGVYGAKLMGAGFGGCTINLVEKGRLGAFMDEMSRVFADDLKKPPKIHIAALSKRTHVMEMV
jgi:galactokinase